MQAQPKKKTFNTSLCIGTKKLGCTHRLDHKKGSFSGPANEIKEFTTITSVNLFVHLPQKMSKSESELS